MVTSPTRGYAAAKKTLDKKISGKKMFGIVYTMRLLIAVVVMIGCLGLKRWNLCH